MMISNSSHEKVGLEDIKELFETVDVDSLDSKKVEQVLKSGLKEQKDEFKLIALKNPSKAVTLSEKAGNPLYIIFLADDEAKFLPIFDILKNMAKQPKNDDELQFAVDSISLYISLNKVPFQKIEFLIGVCIPHMVKYAKCWSAFSRLYSRYCVSDSNDMMEALEQQLDILNAKEDYAPIFKIVGLAFVVNRNHGKTLYLLDSVQDSIRNVNEFSSPTSIKEGLTLLSLLCSDEDLRKEIAAKFLGILVHGIKSNDNEIQELSTLVLIKTWSFTQVELEKSISIDDIYNLITKNFTPITIECLAYLSIKPSVRKKLRADDDIIFDLTKALDASQKESQEDLYGVLVVLANLTTVEENSEVSELKKQAQTGLEGDVEEGPEEITEFQTELLERNVLSSISDRMSQLTQNSIAQVVRLIYNLSGFKENRGEVLSQGGLKVLIKILDAGKILQDSKITAYRAISNLLLTTDPSAIFELRHAQFALFLLLQTEELPLKDQLQALISLTNANSIDNGSLSEDQWAIIDQYLNHENTLIRRSAIELVCNLVQHKDGLPGVFNFENQLSRKRYDLLVQYTSLEDVRSQCSAVASLSFGVTFKFIADEVAKDKALLNNLFTILNEQYQEAELLERVLFVLYYLVFNSEDNNEIINSLAMNSQFKKGIELAIRNVKKESEPFEIALEISKIVGFK